jgi:hypothetical protein
MNLPDFLQKLYKESLNGSDTQKEQALFALMNAYRTAIAMTDGVPTHLSVAIAKVLPEEYLGACRDHDAPRIKNIKLL